MILKVPYYKYNEDNNDLFQVDIDTLILNRYYIYYFKMTLVIDGEGHRLIVVVVSVNGELAVTPSSAQGHQVTYDALLEIGVSHPNGGVFSRLLPRGGGVF